MKKRFLSMLLAIALLISLVPVSGITASAASMSISEKAITVLKQLEGYRQSCDENGYIGYGTRCPGKTINGKGHGEGTEHETMKELEADAALREELETLDKAVNSFASKKGISLTQSQHDAMVLFSFQNGTAWTTGTGELQSAVANKATGSDFLQAICWWNTSTGDDLRRMIEANIYLYGVYQTWAPYQFVRVQLNPNGGNMSEAKFQYYDISSSQSVGVTPSKAGSKFIGWYSTATSGTGTLDEGTVVTTISKAQDGKTIYARWQGNDDSMNAANYLIYESDLASTMIYDGPCGNEKPSSPIDGYISEDKTLKVTADYVDKDGVRWVQIGKADDGSWEDWVKLKTTVTGGNVGSSLETDVTVTVTNSYVRRRVNATIHSAQNGTYNQGDSLRIINTANADGFLWGQVATSSTDTTPVGWVALMYTNYESVKDGGNSGNSKVVATATITANGYVNVRSGAGTQNQIVSALPKGTKVDLYETTYVNGIRWGRCTSGWFCLSYASVTDLVDTDDEKGTGLISYAFNGVIQGTGAVCDRVGGTQTTTLTAGTEVTVTHLTLDGSGNTWGKISKGWVKVSDANGVAQDVDLYIAKFEVTSNTLSVREKPSTDSTRVDTLVKGVEFSVNKDADKQVMVKDATVWGYAGKLGENEPSYNGWVNLDSRYVRRVDAPDVDFGDEDTSDEYTGLVATVINTDKVNVRVTGATYGKIIGGLTRGTTAKVLRENDGWYELDVDVDGDPDTGSWVSGQYLDVHEGTIGGSDSDSDTSGGTVKTGIGIIANTYRGVNVRSAAGTGNALVGMILPGTQVTILEVTTKGAAEWGRVEQGWICMDYVTMLRYEEVSGGSSGTGSSGGSTVTGSETAIYTGTIANVGYDINVRKDTHTSADVVRTLKAGDPVTVHEVLTVTEEVNTTTEDGNNAGSTETVQTQTVYWARVNDGYIRNPGDHIVLHTLEEKTYTVTESETLNLRESAPDGEVKSVLKKGDQVSITKLQIIKGNVWGYAEVNHELEGWVSLAYMTPGAVSLENENNNNTNNSASNDLIIGDTGNTGDGGFVTNTTGYKYKGKVINTNELNVRATASQTAAKTTTLKGGAALVIYETTLSEGMAWGRCDAGWVYLYYVDITPSGGTAIDAGVIGVENTIIYGDSNCESTVGTYSRMSVVDIYESVRNTKTEKVMLRTDKGWIESTSLLNP